MLIAAVALVGAVLLLLAFWGHPRRALAVWMVSLAMVPPWISVTSIVRWQLPCLVGILAVVATVLHPSFKSRLKLTKFDVYFALFYVLCVGVLAASAVEAHAPAILFVNWVIPYTTARVLVSATGGRFATDAIAVLFAIVGGLAIVELVLDWHPFTGWDVGSASTYELWRPIQHRLGSPRSEWAFGHSIALGGSLAMSIPFVARSSFRAPVKAVMLVLIGGAVAATGSRGAAVSAILIAGICIVNAEKLRNVRPLAVVVAGIGLLFTVNFLAPQLDSWLIGSARGDRSSALYRGEIYGKFLSRIEWFAPYDVYAPGENANKSIDSTVLDVGLRLGWGVLILAAIPLLIAMARVLIGKASPGEVALFGLVPLFATVALIAQYEQWVFIIAGVTVTMLTSPDSATAECPEVGSPGHVPLRLADATSPGST